MDLAVSAHAAVVGDAAPVEVVERKGLGHPDSICDAIAEEASIALCRAYLRRFDRVLHHNVDKVLLCGGSSRPAFGGGEVVEPIEITVAGRAAAAAGGAGIDAAALVEETARRWLGANLRWLDAERHVRIRSRVRPGSVDLVGLFDRSGDEVLANDTSCGVGHAPRTVLERVVAAVERHLTAAEVRAAHPFVGEDVKVMGVRRRGEIALTVACAFVDRHTLGMDDYRAHRALLAELVREAAQAESSVPVRITVNAADDLERGEIYLTVTGTSAEAGDDGSAGRGNRVGGLITPYRPMTMESAAGKNPISHVGKIYNLLATRIAAQLVDRVAGVTAADCCLVSQIGRPIGDPQLAEVRVRLRDTELAAVHTPIARIVDDNLRRAGDVWRDVIDRAYPIY